MIEIKKYKVRILVQSGWQVEVFDAESFVVSPGYYFFLVDGKRIYYPIANVIVEEI